MNESLLNYHFQILLFLANSQHGSVHESLTSTCSPASQWFWLKKQSWHEEARLTFSGGWVRSLTCVLNWIETSSFQCTIEALRCFHVSSSRKQVNDVYLHLDCVCVYECVCVCPRTCACMYSVMSDSLKPYGLCSPPGSSVHGILQARILEWVAIPFSRVSVQPKDWNQVSCIAGRFFAIWATGEALGLLVLL